MPILVNRDFKIKYSIDGIGRAMTSIAREFVLVGESLLQGTDEVIFDVLLVVDIM